MPVTADPAIDRPVELTRKGECWLGQFTAMASPCEVLMALNDKALAMELLLMAAHEAWRIEQKFSRYRQDSIVHRINNSNGEPITVDPETCQLLDFSYQCYELSEGLFDISSGVLRKAWSFSPGNTLPTQALIDTLLPAIGLQKTDWKPPLFCMPAGMQIDFGGVGKEYAVDRSLTLLLNKVDIPLLVNFGGDIVCNRCPSKDSPWRIGIENTNQPSRAAELLEVRTGAIATSGSSKRYLIAAGKRYGHVLNPTTGWPINDAPLSVTVAARSCTEAGMLATFAMLQGAGAESFLHQQGVNFWISR